MFAHLHVHSDYSFLDGLMSPLELATKAVEVGCDALAITDHGEVSGHIAMFDAAAKTGIKPIFGLEAYQAPVDRHMKQKEHRGHLTLLAQDQQGLKDLWAMSSLSYIEGFYYKPRVDWELLERYGRHLYAGSACLGSFISQAAMKDDYALAKGVSDLYRAIFGERFFIELHTNSLPEQVSANIWLADFAQREGIPLTFASDIHYLEPGDSKFHDALMGIQYKKKSTDENIVHDVPDYYVMSESEVRNALSYLPEPVVSGAISNAGAIAESIQETSLDTSLKIPPAIIPKDFDVPTGEKPGDAYLVYLSMQGIKERFPDGFPDESKYLDRLMYELDFIIKHGLSDYMLTVAGYTRWAKQHMLVGPGRGSAAGSLVLYLISVTEVDPIPANLLFERFLNEGRIGGSLPDIDLDFPTDKRHLIKEELSKWYGDDRVVSIGTVNRMKAKQAIKDAAWYWGVDFQDSNSMTSVIDTVPNITELNAWDEIIAAVADTESLKSWTTRYPGVFHTAEKLFGVARQSSEHAAGVIISPVPLAGYLPMRTKGGEVVTQFDMHAVERLGFLKADILGLRTLETLQKARDLVQERRGVFVDFYRFGAAEESDDGVWQMLGDGGTLGVFQAETSGITDLLRKMKPKSIADLALAIALYRPGILRTEYSKGRNMLDEYLLRREGYEPAAYPDPRLESILGETEGIIVYQEQIIRIATDLAGYSPVSADMLRSIIGKKKLDKMEEERGRLIPALVANGMDQQVAESLYANIREFGAYGFNASHSYSYGIIAFWCAWMKYHYPVEFMCALLNTDPKNIERYILESEKMGIVVSPPHVNKSNKDFSVFSDNEITFGLLGVKWVGAAPADAIMESRPFHSLDDFFERMSCSDVNKRVIDGLMSLGAFSGLPLGGEHLTDVELVKRFEIAKKRTVKDDGRSTSFWVMPQTLPDGWVTKTDTPIRWRRKSEMKYLGFCFTAQTFDEFMERLDGIPISTGKSVYEGAYDVEHLVLARILKRGAFKTKKGKSMAKPRILTSDYQEMDVVVFPDDWQKYNVHFVEGDIVLLLMVKQWNNAYNEDSFIVNQARKGMSDGG